MTRRKFRFSLLGLLQYSTSYRELGKGLTGEGHITVRAFQKHTHFHPVWFTEGVNNFFLTQKWPYLMTFIAWREHAHIILKRLILNFNWGKTLMAGAFGWLLSHEFCWKKQTSEQTFYYYLFILNKRTI